MVVLLLYSIRSVDSGRELRYFLYQGSHNSLLYVVKKLFIVYERKGLIVGQGKTVFTQL